MDKIFIKFLKDRRLYSEYCREYAAFINKVSFRPKTAKKWLSQKNLYKNHPSCLNAITSAFHWRSTKRGYRFWDSIDNEWIKYLKEYELKQK